MTAFVPTTTGSNRASAMIDIDSLDAATSSDNLEIGTGNASRIQMGNAVTPTMETQFAGIVNTNKLIGCFKFVYNSPEVMGVVASQDTNGAIVGINTNFVAAMASAGGVVVWNDGGTSPIGTVNSTTSMSVPATLVATPGVPAHVLQGFKIYYTGCYFDANTQAAGGGSGIFPNLNPDGPTALNNIVVSTTSTTGVNEIIQLSDGQTSDSFQIIDPLDDVVVNINSHYDLFVQGAGLFTGGTFQACANLQNTGTIGTSGATVTGAGTSFDATNIGGLLFKTNGDFIGMIISVTSATVCTLAPGNFFAAPGSTFAIKYGGLSSVSGDDAYIGSQIIHVQSMSAESIDAPLVNTPLEIGSNTTTTKLYGSATNILHLNTNDISADILQGTQIVIGGDATEISLIAPQVIVHFAESDNASSQSIFAQTIAANFTGTGSPIVAGAASASAITGVFNNNATQGDTLILSMGTVPIGTYLISFHALTAVAASTVVTFASSLGGGGYVTLGTYSGAITAGLTAGWCFRQYRFVNSASQSLSLRWTSTTGTLMGVGGGVNMARLY